MNDVKSLSRIFAGALLGTALAAGAVQAADGWDITPLVLPGDFIGGKTIVKVYPNVDMDEAGNVAFIADFMESGTSGRGIFTQDRVVVIVGDVISDSIKTEEITDINPDISNSRPSIANGTVAYVANSNTLGAAFNQTIYGVFMEQTWVVHPGDQLDVFGDIASRPFCCPASMNSSGTVAFNSGASNTPNEIPGFPGNFNTGQAIYTKPIDVASSVVIRANQTYEAGTARENTLSQVRETDISNGGDVVSKVSIHNGDGSSSGAIMLNDTFAILPGDPIGPTTYGGGGGTVSINNLGNEIAFGGTIAYLTGFRNALMTSTRVVATQNEVKDGITIIGLGFQEINDSDAVAYLASHGVVFGSRRGALFLDDDLVAKPGDVTNDGQQLIDVASVFDNGGTGPTKAGVGFNNAGDIAFGASYDEGGATLYGLFVAAPMSEDPVEQTVALIEDVVAVVEAQSLALNHGLSKKLLASLDDVGKQIEKGHIDAAIDQLNDFIDLVVWFEGKGRLTTDQRDSLAGTAQVIIDTLTA
ncbi:MAG: hypothetical protein V7742_13020 [Halioglobus sp.]